MKSNYNELFISATKSTATKNDRIALAKWFENYGHDCGWNGESWNGENVYPVYDETEYGKFEIIDAIIK